MSLRSVLLAALLGIGCHHAGDGSPSGGDGTTPTAGAGAVVGTGGSGAVGTGGPGTGGTFAGGGSGGGGQPAGGGAGGSPAGSPPADASLSTDSSFTVDAGTCPFSMAATPCAPAGASCTFNSDCVARRCDCVNGNWACSERQLPCGTAACPTPQSAQCGSACTGEISGCLCHCGGGGPNYAGCSCTGGRWACGCH